ncbi:MAG: hypothetical protein KF883_03430 [Thermomicrobiales bacterium]|nr:hypothetical protein [Thermomicrobiales bacterium]
MDGNRFDRLTRSLAAGASRRQIIKGFLGLGGAAAAGSLAPDAGARDARTRPTVPPPPPPATTTSTTAAPPLCPGQDQCPNSTLCCPTGTCARSGNQAICCPSADRVCGRECCADPTQCCDRECCGTGHTCLTQIFAEGPNVQEESCCPTGQTCDNQCCTGACYDPGAVTFPSVPAGSLHPELACCPAGGTVCVGDAGSLCCGSNTPQCCVRGGVAICIAADACCDDGDCSFGDCSICDPVSNRCVDSTPICATEVGPCSVCRDGFCIDEQALCPGCAVCDAGQCIADDNRCGPCEDCVLSGLAGSCEFNCSSDFPTCCVDAFGDGYCIADGATCCIVAGDCPESVCQAEGTRWDHYDCEFGICVLHQTTCNDGNACTADTCNDATGCSNINLVANTGCGMCRVCDGQGNCEPVVAGQDPNGDCGVCQVCNGAGGCLARADGPAPSPAAGWCCGGTHHIGGTCCTVNDCQDGGACLPNTCNLQTHTCSGPVDTCAPGYRCDGDACVCDPQTCNGLCCSVEGVATCVTGAECCLGENPANSCPPCANECKQLQCLGYACNCDTNIGDGTDFPCDDVANGFCCAGVCTPFGTDQNCTFCGQTCSDPANGTSTCGDGGCEITCNQGYVKDGDQCVESCQAAGGTWVNDWCLKECGDHGECAGLCGEQSFPRCVRLSPIPPDTTQRFYCVDVANYLGECTVPNHSECGFSSFLCSAGDGVDGSCVQICPVPH